MNRIILLTLGLIGGLAGMAQERPTQTGMKFGDKQKQGAQFELPYAPDIVQKAIEDHMARKGSRAESMKGYTLFRGVSGYGPRADLYFNVERKGRRDKNISLIRVFAVNPNDNPASTDPADSRVEDSKAVLESLVSAIEAKDNETNVRVQTSRVQEAERKLKKLRDDYAGYEEKVNALQERMTRNKQEQEAQLAEIEKLKEILEAMKTKGTE